MTTNSKISLLQALPLGIGSIIGSGILFLPSLTYRVAGSDVGLVWLVAVLICIPGVIFFKDMMKNGKNDDGMAGFVEMGLGKYAGNSVYLLLFGTVIIGMPSAAIIAGDYMQYLFLGAEYVKEITAFVLLLVALVVNLGGIKTSSKVSFVVAFFLFIVAVMLIALSGQKIDGYEAIKPQYNFMNTYSGIVLAFWAFAGFENLTFLSNRFKNPERDLVITILVSVLVCGSLYFGLVANYAALVPSGEIENTVGLLQIASYTGSPILKFAIGIFALLAVLINLVSWTSGISAMIRSGAEKGLMPEFILKGDSEKKSILFLGVFFMTSLIIGVFQRELFLDMLSMVSTNFLIIYCMGIFSYFIFIQSKVKKFLSIIVSIFLTLTLTSSGYLLIYPFLLILISSMISMRREAKVALI